jgi:two-component system, OmpR family, phosphate regulon sensor histidine kinase PhoR
MKAYRINEGTVMSVQRFPETSAPYSWKIDPSQGGDLQAALLGMVGHDLRQPLQVVQSTYNLLRSSVRTASERTYLDQGQSAIDRMIDQLNRLLATLRFYDHTKAVELSSVLVAPLLFRLQIANVDAARQRGIDIRLCATSARVVSNPVLLEGMLGNLLTNAIKYTERGGRVLIGCRRFGSRIRIEIYDTGIGISPQELPNIFDLFARLDPTRNDGRGVGLFVVRRALEVLGHEIDVRSAVSRGSRFSIIANAVDAT